MSNPQTYAHMASLEFFQILKQNDSKITQKSLGNGNRGTHNNYFYEASVTLISTPHKCIRRKEKYRNIILMSTVFKNYKQNNKRNQVINKEINTSNKLDLLLEYE